MPAITASHMITTFIFIDCDSTFWAVYRTSLFLPLLKLLILFRLAALSARMGLLTTIEAYLSLTFTACDYILTLDWTLADVAVACRLGAPAQIWIKIYHSIALEALILIEQVFTNTVLYIIFTEFLRTASIHTANIDNLALIDSCIEVVFVAKVAEFVLASQTVEFRLLGLLIA